MHFLPIMIVINIDVIMHQYVLISKFNINHKYDYMQSHTKSKDDKTQTEAMPIFCFVDDALNLF